jgi:hypothetical protein
MGGIFMPNASTTLLGITFLALISASPSRGQTVDWKLYGGANVGGESLCFYDAKGAITADQHVRAWTKCLPKAELDNIDLRNAKYHDIVELAAQEIANGYVPPIVAAGFAKFVNVPDIAGMEEIADLAGIKPVASISYELNCSEHMIRELSLYVTKAGHDVSSDVPLPWRYIPPETSSAQLQQLLCTLEPPIQ